jgi:hypothetical protein
MKVPFRLRRCPAGHSAIALFVPRRDAADVLRLCSMLGIDPAGRVFDIAGGFLVKLDDPLRGPAPGAVRLRALADNLYLPVDADLVPALLDDEAAGLVRDRGLVFLPAGRVLAFDPKNPVDPSTLLTADFIPRRDWQPLPDRPALADRIAEIVFDRPQQSADDVIEALAAGPEGGEGEDTGGDAVGSVGGEPLRPADAGAASTAAGRAALALGKALERLGGVLGSGKLAAAGAEWIERALRFAPRLNEDLLGRQAAALRELLREFREGNIERALRHALPLSEPGEQRGAPPSGSDRLPPVDLSYGLSGLLGPNRGVSLWLGGQPDIMAELTREYRKAAEEALRRGDFRRAAAIYGKLLRDYRAAANALIRGRLFRDAAVLMLERLDDRRGAACAFESAGEFDLALSLYRGLYDHVAAGDLLRRIGEEDEAVAEYVLAADRLAQDPGGLLAAGELLLDKAGRSELARPRFADGWARRPGLNAVSCALRLATLDTAAGDTPALTRLADEADDLFAGPPQLHDASRLYNHLASLAAEPLPADARDALRDRALVGLAAQLRAATRAPGPVDPAVSALLGKADWPAAIVSDASFAARTAERPAAAAVPEPPASGRGARRFRVAVGQVTAAAAAAGTGDVVLGFASGAVHLFRPAGAEVVSILTPPHLADLGPGYSVSVSTDRLPVAPVAAVSIDPEGEWVVALHLLRDRGGMARLSTYARQPDGSYRSAAGSSAVEYRGPCWLTPVAPDVPTSLGEPFFGFWSGVWLSLMPCSTLGFWATTHGPSPEWAPLAGFLTEAAPGSDDDFGWLLHDGFQWTHTDARGASPRPTSLAWCPAVPPGVSLHVAPLLAATAADESSLELAGVDAEGRLHYAQFVEGHLIAHNVASAEGVFFCGCVVRPGLVAGVTNHRVEWFRCGASKFLPWRTTHVFITSPVACFPSPRTSELIVACGDGFVARVPYPT